MMVVMGMWRMICCFHNYHARTTMLLIMDLIVGWNSHSRLITTRHRQGPWRSSPWIHISTYFSVKYTEQNIDTPIWAPLYFSFLITHNHAFIFKSQTLTFSGAIINILWINLYNILTLTLGAHRSSPKFCITTIL